MGECERREGEGEGEEEKGGVKELTCTPLRYFNEGGFLRRRERGKRSYEGEKWKEGV